MFPKSLISIAALGVFVLSASIQAAGILALVPSPAGCSIDSIQDGKVASSTKVATPFVYGIDESQHLLYLAGNQDTNVTISVFDIFTGEAKPQIDVVDASLFASLQMPAHSLFVIDGKVTFPTMIIKDAVRYQLVRYDEKTKQVSRIELPQTIATDIFFPVGNETTAHTSVSGNELALFSLAERKEITSITEPGRGNIPFFLGDTLYAWTDNGQIQVLAKKNDGNFKIPAVRGSLQFMTRIGRVRPLLVDGKPFAVVPQMDLKTSRVNRVSICDLTSMKVSSEVDLTIKTRHVFPSGDLKQLWIVDDEDGNLKVLDSHSGQVLTTIETKYDKETRAGVILFGSELNRNRP